MPKTPSRKLYDLIHALSGSEKRYFKLFVKAEKNNKYIRLFDAIEAQADFDDEVLQQKIYKGQPIESRKYSELKSYLYDLVLKSLQSFDEKSSIDYKIKGYLQSVRVLFKRGRFNDCKELLQKTKKTAHKYEDFTALLEVLRWEKQIAYSLIDVAFMDKEIERIDKEEKIYIKQLQNLSEYRNIFFRILTSIKKAVIGGGIQELDTLIKNPLLKDENTTQSHHAKLLYNRIYSLYYYANEDLDSFYQFNKKLIHLMESKPYLLNEDVSEYISVLSNNMLSCHRLNKFQEWQETIDKFLKIKPNTYDDKLKIHRQYYQGKLAYCIITGQFKNGLEVLQQHFEKVQEFDKDLFERSVFYYYYFCIYFGVGDYDNALGYLNDWLNLPRNIERQDFQVYVHLMNLIIHFEMGNAMLLESLLRSAYRYLRKSKTSQPIEHQILNFIKSSMKTANAAEHRKLLEKFKEEMSDIQKAPRTRPFDLTSWLESKIFEKTFEQVIREKHLEFINKS